MCPRVLSSFTGLFFETTQPVDHATAAQQDSTPIRRRQNVRTALQEKPTMTQSLKHPVLNALQDYTQRHSTQVHAVRVQQVALVRSVAQAVLGRMVYPSCPLPRLSKKRLLVWPAQQVSMLRKAQSPANSAPPVQQMKTQMLPLLA